jgi:parallel beta-helix repeat protein
MVRGNVIEHVATGIQLYGDQCNGAVIDGNTIRDITGSAIQSYNSHNCTFMNNNISDVAWYAVSIEGSKYNNVVNNTIVDCGRSATYKNVINLSTATSITPDYNTIQNNVILDRAGISCALSSPITAQAAASQYRVPIGTDAQSYETWKWYSGQPVGIWSVAGLEYKTIDYIDYRLHHLVMTAPLTYTHNSGSGANVFSASTTDVAMREESGTGNCYVNNVIRGMATTAKPIFYSLAGTSQLYDLQVISKEINLADTPADHVDYLYVAPVACSLMGATAICTATISTHGHISLGKNGDNDYYMTTKAVPGTGDSMSVGATLTWDYDDLTLRSVAVASAVTVSLLTSGVGKIRVIAYFMRAAG